MLWFCHKRRLSDSGLLSGFTDCHSHILPEVDDGVETMDESLAILSCYEASGVSEVWLTPHIMEDVPNETVTLRQRFSQLSAAYQGSITLHLSAEYMIDSLFRARLTSGDLLPWGKQQNRLLVETSCFGAPAGFRALLHEIAAKGYYPVLAHPERYMYMAKSDYRQLHSLGVEFQLNLFSLLGMYGKEAQLKAKLLLKAGAYSYIGSDLHRYAALEHALQQRLSAKTVQRLKDIADKLRHNDL